MFSIGCRGVDNAERSIYIVILPEVLLARMHIISKFVSWALPPKQRMPLDTMQVAKVWVICKLCCYDQFAMPEVAICTEHFVIPVLSAGIWYTGECLEYRLQYYFSVHLGVFASAHAAASE